MSFSQIQEYNAQLKAVQARFGGLLQIFKGLEADFIPDRTIPFRDWHSLLHLDYLIGGIHFVSKAGSDAFWHIDGSQQQYDETLHNLFGEDIKAAVTAYYSQVRMMIEEEKPDMVAHLDKVLMHNANRLFSETDNWYQQELDRTLDVIADAGTIVEINTRGIYKKRHSDFFPSTGTIKKCVDRGIPLTISADAHECDEMCALFDDAAKAIAVAGGRHVMYLNQGRWNQVMLSDIE